MADAFASLFGDLRGLPSSAEVSSRVEANRDLVSWQVQRQSAVVLRLCRMLALPEPAELRPSRLDAHLRRGFADLLHSEPLTDLRDTDMTVVLKAVRRALAERVAEDAALAARLAGALGDGCPVPGDVTAFTRLLDVIDNAACTTVVDSTCLELIRQRLRQTAFR